MSVNSRLQRIFEAGLAAVAPDEALLRHVRLEGDMLRVGGREWSLANRRVLVLGAGKGAAPMAQSLEKLLGERITQGLVVVKYDHSAPLERICLEEAAHPVPDAAGVNATRRMLDMAKASTEDHMVICVFTGGASALTPAPAEGLTLEDMQTTTSLLLACGATIHELNAIRKHLSVFTGGQLARAAFPSPVLAVIVSDVVGDPLDVIASGPTAPDPSSFATCMDIVRQYGIEDRLPSAVRERLTRGLSGEIAETPKADDPLFANVHNVLVANNGQALHAAAAKARELGFEPIILTDTMTGEARDRAREVVAEAQSRLVTMKPGDTPLCLLAGGETTVTIRGVGKGGRNQEMALTACLVLENEPRITALFAGTDGTDGPTDAAGGFAYATALAALDDDPATARRKAEASLDNNDSYHTLKEMNALYITGPTRTNVMDMAIVLVQP